MNQTQNISTVKPLVLFVFTFLAAVDISGLFGKLWIIAWMTAFSYWTLVTGQQLHTKLRDKQILDVQRFKWQIAFVLIYLSIVFLITDGGYQITDENYMEYGWKAWIIIPLHLLVTIFIIHTIYFLSRCITTLRQRAEGYGWYMLGFWFFPIGVWIIQPRIIELIKNNYTQHQPSK
jgi:hypothetical protein